jgi:hypothetical protein
MRGASLSALALLLVAGCRETPPPLASCAEPLEGVWTAADTGRRWHVVDQRRGGRGRVELWPMWDTTWPEGGAKPVVPADPAAPGDPTPVRSPLRMAVFAAPGKPDLAGTGGYRVTRDGRTCEIEWPARLSGCAGARATLSTRPVTAVAPDGCETALATAWTDVILTRQ